MFIQENDFENVICKMTHISPDLNLLIKLHAKASTND